MLSSSVEYLHALRERKYLLFLQWPDFIMHQYTKESHDLDADATENILVFEWLAQGFKEEDVKNIALLYAVYSLESRPLRGKLDYALNAINVALFLCKIFHKYHLGTNFFIKKQEKPQAINLLIKETMTRLDKTLYYESLNDIQKQFFQEVELTNKEEVKAVFLGIDLITKPRYVLEDYILYLEQDKLSEDVLVTARLSMAKRFLSYLYEQTQLTYEVSEQIVSYVKAIRDMHPPETEQVFLDNIVPPTNLQNTWRWVTGIGMSFYNVVLKEKSIAELISGAEKKQTDPNRN